jgi:hypothetical protein
MERVFTDHQFDEISVVTLPQLISRWLRADLPRRAIMLPRLPEQRALPLLPAVG